ncbi:hypothetical protein MMYC01_210055 [Madurella mycetomatis]|uniref:Transmembrane protein n=1 Tax=Madurella mycetomatis TaxID=100816 RepID=A0A175VRC3_9PEZI|nr:hypothetical protein MMYC01_210055 [Madurella mycetomatis]
MGLILSVFATFILPPLVASLIKEQESTFVSDTTTHRLLEFNGNTLANLEPHQWNLILNSVIAEDQYAGEVSPWTNRTHAFRPFEPQKGFSDRGTLTAASTAYAAHLSCEKVEGAILQLDDFGMNIDQVRVNLTATDRNCNIAYDFIIHPTNRPLVVEAFHQTACGLDNSLTRVVVLTATASNEETPRLSNPNLTSCVVAYSSTSGNLTVHWANGIAPFQNSTTSNGRTGATAAPTFVSFSDTEPVTPKKDFLQATFEGNLLAINVLQYGSTQDQIANNEFADFVMAVATGLLPSSPNPSSGDIGSPLSLAPTSGAETALAIIHTPEVLLQAMPLAFASIYRVAVARMGMVPARAVNPEETAVMGRLETMEMRLWVRYWLVAVMMVYLLASTLSSIWLMKWWGWTIQVGEQSNTACASGNDGQLAGVARSDVNGEPGSKANIRADVDNVDNVDNVDP